MEEKTELKVLPCHPGHVFCLPCLERHRDDKPDFLCPQCKVKTQLQGETAATLESRFFGFMECKVCRLNKRTDRLRWCVECRSYLCAQCVERDEHWEEQHTTSPFHTLTGLRAAFALISCVERDEHWEEQHTTSPFHTLTGLRAAFALISEREEAIDSLEERIEDFCKSLCSQLKRTLGSDQRSPKTAEKIRATFRLPGESSSGGLSAEEAADIANLALGMMGETGDARPLAAPVRMPSADAAESLVLGVIFNAASRPSSPAVAASASLQAISAAQSAVPSPPRLTVIDHPLRDTSVGPVATTNTTRDTTGFAEARVVIMNDRNIEVLYPFSTAPSVCMSFNELPSGGCYGATPVSNGRQFLVTGGLVGNVPSNKCWSLYNAPRIQAPQCQAPVPLTTCYHACTTLGDAAYLVGASGGSAGGTGCMRWQEGVWSAIASLPQRVRFVSAASPAVSTSLYAIGNGPDNIIFSRYDTGTDRWIRLPPPVSYGGRNAMAILERDAYVMGLGTWDSQTVHVYREDSGEWNLGTPLPSGRNSLVTLNNRLLALEKTTATIHVLEPHRNAWRQLDKRQENNFYRFDACVPLPSSYIVTI